jgi:predicted DCC family thiol-disulfide oxidoreductase YuxK
LQPRGAGSEYTVVYDGNCGICQRLVRKLGKWDRDRLLEIVPSQNPGVQARFPWISARAYSESLQLVRADGRTWQGAAAIEELLRAVPRGRFISWIFRVPFVRPLAEKFYRWFARRRYKLGCGQHCRVKAADLPSEPESGR